MSLFYFHSIAYTAFAKLKLITYTAVFIDFMQTSGGLNICGQTYYSNRSLTSVSLYYMFHSITLSIEISVVSYSASFQYWINDIPV